MCTVISILPCIFWFLKKSRDVPLHNHIFTVLFVGFFLQLFHILIATYYWLSTFCIISQSIMVCGGLGTQKPNLVKKISSVDLENQASVDWVTSLNQKVNRVKTKTIVDVSFISNYIFCQTYSVSVSMCQYVRLRLLRRVTVDVTKTPRYTRRAKLLLGVSSPTDSQWKMCKIG